MGGRLVKPKADVLWNIQPGLTGMHGKVLEEK
jgi:hypothetical protein